VPRTTRSATIPAPPDEVWRTVADPHHLPRWWPRVQRVEGVEPERFTQVLVTDQGRTVRADFRVLESRAPAVRRWAQDVAGTPFERVLRSAETEVRLEPAREGETRVTLTLRQRLRGSGLLGTMLVRRAAADRLDEALAALARLHGG
jgi:uncharacterized protein YndB with AHSA1/START domain